MDSIFGRKKGRPRQSSVSADLNERSVPYDKLGPAPRSPLPIGTVNQGFRGISAPNTNPALTTTGTELNKFAMQRSKAERERIYEQHGFQKRPGSPSTSFTADSSTLYEESMPSSSSKYLPQTPQPTRVRLSEVSITSSRTSKYAPSLSSSDTHHSLFYHTRSNQSSASFYFPRPDTEEEIEVLFENVKRTRDLGELPELSLDQKWHMVYNDEHIRWKEERTREEQSKRQTETGQPAVIVLETPEWYIKKFLDRTITPKQAGGLLVSLRSKQVSWFEHFINIQGTSVLAQTLMHISRKGASRLEYRRETDIALEYEIVKCLKHIFNNKAAAVEALTHNSIVTQIASSLNTPHLPTRKLVLDLLCFLVYWNDGEAHYLVVTALEALSAANNEGGGCYDYWFKSMEYSLSGRGKMGSLVGASDEVKRSGGLDSSLNDYAASILYRSLA